MTKLACPILLLCLLPLAACEPPQQKVLDTCRTTASQRAHGQGLTPNDVGELVEACMTDHGYLLHKTDASCAHDLASQSQRRCYYPNTFLGRLHRRLADG